ncbi:MAG: ABC transporter permease [Dehalococcoidia bacterium]
MAKSLLRILTFFGRWFAEFTRQPALMLTLVVGPFFILLSFGAGIQDTPPEPDIIIVTRDDDRSETGFSDEVLERFNIISMTADEAAARRALHAGTVDAVLILPPRPEQSFERGEHAHIRVLTNYVDPAQDLYAKAYLRNQINALNQETTRQMVEEAQQSTVEMRETIAEVRQYTAAAGTVPGNPEANDLAEMDERLELADETIQRFDQAPPSLVSSPFELEVENVAELVPDYTAFYGPAVLVLLLQHLAVTLGALTMTRLRLLGVMDLIRISPVRPMEMVAGHYLSYATLCGLAAVTLAALLVYALNVPLFGGLGWLVASLALLIVSSLGIGFVIAALSSSEQQSAQAAMLVLLAAIFFSGLIFPLGQVAWPARAISYSLPSTYGIRSVQDLMLRGDVPAALDLVVLGGAGLALFIATVLLLRREWRPA